MTGTRIGRGVNRAADWLLQPLVARMARNRTLGTLAGELSHTSGLLALSLGFNSWEAGSALKGAAVDLGFESYSALLDSYSTLETSLLPGSLTAEPAGYLERSHVIANHKLVSFHAAFISSLLSLPESISGKLETLEFVFLSAETVISSAILYLSWHAGIAIHELGHYVTAAKLTALNDASQKAADSMRGESFLAKVGWYSKIIAKTPWGKFEGVKKEGGNFAPDAPYNLAVAAAGPRWSGYMALACLPVATLAISLGLVLGSETAIYIGRFFLAPGAVGLLDRFLADRGKLNEFRTRERLAAERAAQVAETATAGSLLDRLAGIRSMLSTTRMQSITLADGRVISAPWQYRNCGMGGRHTEKEYPESNISMQEAMFIPLTAQDYGEAQEWTVRLQTRLKEILESIPGARILGIGLEGGIAPYLEKESQDKVPEQRLWRMMKQAIADCGLRPGMDVAIALDPAASELENAYRDAHEQPDSVGMYLFWRGGEKVEMSRDQLVDLYKTAIERDGVPIVSIEDGFGERDHAGWALAMKELGDKILIIGDDLVTTKDSSVENCAGNGIMNATLIKANQIGTLMETILAVLTSWAYDAEVVVSHRSKSPNDPFEADIAIAFNALGMKTGGGANTERLQKYGRVIEIIALAQTTGRQLSRAERQEVERMLRELVTTLTGQTDVELVEGAADTDLTRLMLSMLSIEAVIGTEDSTNAGIPTAAATVLLGHSGTIRFKGATPLGSSAGEDEAIHLVDSIIQSGELTTRHADLFRVTADGTYRFKKGLKRQSIAAIGDAELLTVWDNTQRYGGKGCLDAVSHINGVLAKAFEKRSLIDLGSLLKVDRELLGLEREQAIALGKLDANAPYADQVHAMQRKAGLGMNAILSISLALGRAFAAMEGKELWELIREQAIETMAHFIANNTADPAQKDVATLKAIGIDELRVIFRQVSEGLIRQGRSIHMALRKELPVYPVPEEALVRRYIFDNPELLGQLDKQHQAEMAILGNYFVPEGQMVYRVKMGTGLNGNARPYLWLDQESRKGAAVDYVSKAADGWVETSSHKGGTFVPEGELAIFIDLIDSRHGEAVAGKIEVNIPHRNPDDPNTGTITSVIGTLNDIPLQVREMVFADKLNSLMRYAGDYYSELGRQVTPATREIVRQAFARIPAIELFIVSKQALFETRIKPDLK